MLNLRMKDESALQRIQTELQSVYWRRKATGEWQIVTDEWKR